MPGLSDNKYNRDDIISAHNKWRKKSCGVGGIRFTPEEQAVLDNHIPFPEDAPNTANDD